MLVQLRTSQNRFNSTGTTLQLIGRVPKWCFKAGHHVSIVRLLPSLCTLLIPSRHHAAQWQPRPSLRHYRSRRSAAPDLHRRQVLACILLLTHGSPHMGWDLTNSDSRHSPALRQFPRPFPITAAFYDRINWCECKKADQLLRSSRDHRVHLHVKLIRCSRCAQQSIVSSPTSRQTIPVGALQCTCEC